MRLAVDDLREEVTLKAILPYQIHLRVSQFRHISPIQETSNPATPNRKLWVRNGQRLSIFLRHPVDHFFPKFSKSENQTTTSSLLGKHYASVFQLETAESCSAWRVNFPILSGEVAR
jgi:hypothetical protein